MKKIQRTLIQSVMGLMLATTSAQGYTVFLDMDVSTSPPPGPGPGGPPIPPVGVESTIAVTSGTIVTVIAYIVHTTGAAVFDSVGLDIQYGIPTDTAAAAYLPGTTLAGGITSTGIPIGFDLGMVAPTPAPFGAPLTPLSLPTAIGYLGNAGGAGIYDPTPGSYFGGFGAPPIVGTYFDVMGMDFMVVGSPGDVVTLDPFGVFLPGGHVPGTPATGVPLPPGGFGAEAVYDSLAGLTAPGAFIGGTITIVPEPSSITMFTFGCIGFLLRRKR